MQLIRPTVEFRCEICSEINYTNISQKKALSHNKKDDNLKHFIPSKWIIRCDRLQRHACDGWLNPHLSETGLPFSWHGPSPWWLKSKLIVSMNPMADQKGYVKKIILPKLILFISKIKFHFSFEFSFYSLFFCDAITRVFLLILCIWSTCCCLLSLDI